MENSLWGVTAFSTPPNLTPRIAEHRAPRLAYDRHNGRVSKTKIELRQIKNGTILELDGKETYYEQEDQATRKIVPIIQELLTNWQRRKEKGKITMVFEHLVD